MIHCRRQQHKTRILVGRMNNFLEVTLFFMISLTLHDDSIPGVIKDITKKIDSDKPMRSNEFDELADAIRNIYFSDEPWPFESEEDASYFY